MKWINFDGPKAIGLCALAIMSYFEAVLTAHNLIELGLIGGGAQGYTI